MVETFTCKPRSNFALLLENGNCAMTVSLYVQQRWECVKHGNTVSAAYKNISLRFPAEALEEYFTVVDRGAMEA